VAKLRYFGIWCANHFTHNSMKSMPCQPVYRDRSVARKSLSTMLSIACSSTLGAIGLCLIGFVTLPIGSAIAEPLSLPSTEQQRPLHQKLMGTWDIIIPAEAPIDKSESGQIIFQSSTELTVATYRAKKLTSVEKSKYQIVSIRNINSSQLITLKITNLTSRGESSTMVLLQFQGDRQLKIENINRLPNTQKFTTAAILGQKISDSTNIPVLNETEDNGVPESSPAAVSSTEQEAIVHRKLAGTWIRYPMKDESTKDVQDRVVFRSEKEIENLNYRLGKLSSTNKMSYQIVAIYYSPSSSQLITIKFIDPSSQGKKDDPILVLVEFKNDRQLKIGLANKNSTSPSFGTDAILVDKISDSTNTPDRIPFKASLKSAENEALSNVSTVLRAQLVYKVEKGQYATNIGRLEIGSDLFDRSDRNQFYSYRTTKIGNDRATVVAIPKNKKLRGYIALTYAYRNAGVGIVYETTICESDRPGRTNLGNPIVVVKGSQRAIQCPRGSHKVTN
jgi:hypothetical protein